MVSMPIYFQYWGKTRPDPLDAGASCHLLPYHSLDVAAVGRALLTENPAYLTCFQQLTGIASEDVSKWIVFLLALHDIGKFADSFQNLNPDMLMRLQGRESDREYYVRHDSLGWLLWEKCLREQCQASGMMPQSTGSGRRKAIKRPIDIWMSAMVGHHGQPPNSAGGYQFEDSFNEPTDCEAATAFYNDLVPLLLGDTVVFPDCDMQAIKMASWWLSGFAVLCDWLGSNTCFFPYQDTCEPIVEYWEKARQRAAQAIKATELTGSSVSSSLGLADLIELPEGVEPNPTPLQQAVSDQDIVDSPQVFILEDVTGAGKTEAAVLLAHRLMRRGLAKSVYFALPTMATANTMYGRMQHVYQKFFSPSAHPSLILAHGAAAMSDGFQQSIVGQYPQHVGEYDANEQSAEAHCNAWLADNRKKALLAEIGVGTIDQALLAVLPARHQSLRLLGLLNKVLIVDEVHACDCYQHELLCRLLEAHAAAGGSAILLSATLPHQQRQSLLQAYADGRNWPDVMLQKTDDESYPLLSCLDMAGLKEQVMATRDSVKREVNTVFLQDQGQVEQLLKTTVENNHCVCWIRNTVKDAIESYQQLSADYPDWNIDLFHARYALGDRIEIEKRVVERFDKQSDAIKRRGQVLIATQVVEQSLDLDFDALVTDLAPIDLLIQRAGRLRRHSRDQQGNRVSGQDQRGEVCLHIFSPPMTESPTAKWYAACFPSAQNIYANHGQLWLTANLLHQQGKFRMPEDARRLIEGVYSEEAQDKIPEGLLYQSLEAEGSDRANASVAYLNALNMKRGYPDISTNRWFDEGLTPTRLGEQTTTVYLAKWQDGRLSPWSSASQHEWPLSGVSMRTYWVAKEADLPELSREMLEAFKAEHLPAKGRWGVLVPMEQAENGVWLGSALSENNELVRCAYSKEFGLVVNSDSL
ncbi:MAG: CRISPR-associated helicase/endonuclease Cas3 [Proteobacteria bacterium]|nr:MAG: CRISPR-associated helicase/endonuclease Cas3 [Pseudomonadota bacterium]